MQISELSRRSGLAIPTIKFYLREGLLPAGEATGATRALYDETHVRRLRLIRALVDVAKLRLETVRHIIAAVDDDSLPLHEVVGAAHHQLSAGSSADSSDSARDRVDALVRRRRWRVDPSSSHRDALARALTALETLDQPPSDELLDAYADAMEAVAAREVAGIGDDPSAATERAVIGTVLLEPVLLTIRRMAQEHASARRARPARGRAAPACAPRRPRSR